MDNSDIQKNIFEIINLYEKMLDIIAHLDKYFSSIAYLNSCFHEGVIKITQLSNSNYQINEVNDNLNTFRKACEDFLLTFQLLHELIWPRIFLSLETKDIFDSVSNFIKTTTDLFEKLGLGQMNSITQIDQSIIDISSLLKIHYNNSKQIVSKNTDLTNEIDLVSQFSRTDLERQIDLQLSQISQIFKDRNESPMYISVNSPEHPLKYITNWKFNIDGLVDEKNIIFEQCPLKLCSTPVEKKKVLKLEIEATSEKNHEKQLILLSALKRLTKKKEYKYVLPLLGGNVNKEEKKVTCIFDYENNMTPLSSNMLKKIKNTTLNSYTKLAYEIAKAILYLHSKSIAHGNINTKSVIYILESQRIDVFLYNFGLSTKNKLDSRLIPPELYENKIFNKNSTESEYFSDSIYSFQTDIYQFGQLLFEMAKCPEKNLTEIMDKNYNYQEKLKQCCSPNMIKLIKDCLNENPKNRPTISEIVHRFQAGDVFFISKKLEINKVKMIAHFNDDRFKKMKNIDKLNEKFNSILQEVEDYPNLKENTSRGFANYINTVITINDKDLTEEKKEELKKKREITLKKLNEINFFERIIKFFDISDENVLDQFAKAYIKVFQPMFINIFKPKSIGREFLLNGGDEVIVKFIEIGKGENALLILDSIIKYFQNDKEKTLISTECLFKIIVELTKIKELKYICKIIDLDNIETSVKIESISPIIDDISKLFAQQEYKDYSLYIVKYFLQYSSEYSKSLIINYKLRDTIKSGDLNFLRQLLKFRVFAQSITHADIEEAIKIFVSEASEQKEKECALLTFIGLDNEYFEAFSCFHQIIDLVLNNPNQELASRFIARVTQFSSASEYILSEIEKDTESPFNKIIDCQMPWYLVSLSRIALFFPNRISNIDQLKLNLIRNLNEMSNVEGTLRLLGVLSKAKDFWTDLKLAKTFIYVLRTNYLTQLEKSILLSVISNIISIEEVNRFYSQNENYFEILFNAEVKGKDSGLCIRILSRLTVPKQPDRGNTVLIQRLASVIKDQLENGDKFGIEGSSHLIITMIDHYKETPEFGTVINCLQNVDITNTIISKAKEEQDIVIFIKLMRSLNKLGIKSNANVTSMFSNMIMNCHSTIPNEFYDLRRSMCQ